MGRSLDVIIVNWNAGEQLRQCLEAIAATKRRDVDLRSIVVVDNGSSDSSLEGIDRIRLPTRIVLNNSNRGFAAACNQGAKDSTADYLLFLNPDTRVQRNALTDPIQFMEKEENERIGVLGIQLVDERGRVTRTCARFPTVGRFVAKMIGLDRALPKLFPPHFMTEWDHADSRAVDQVMGAYFLIRCSLFKELGGFDERFFVYFEEVDLTVRARRKGWSTFYLSNVQTYHRGGGVTEQVKARRLFYSLRSRVLYGYKHFGRWKGTLLMLTTLFIEPFSRLTRAAARRSPAELVQTVHAYALLWRALPRAIARSQGVIVGQRTRS
ncbi:MAG: glycosyltransferase family 2 protein [Acidobacteria bacterium]|nr:MAG: glycosyltransferase family 2 protein [Acidobacteriota bacterium]